MNTKISILAVAAALGAWFATSETPVDARIVAPPVAQSMTSDFQDELAISALPAAKEFCAKPGNGWKTVAVKTEKYELIHHCAD